MGYLVAGLVAAWAFGVGVLVGIVMHLPMTPPTSCPVPDHSEVVCGYVSHEYPNHAGLYLRGTGCADYDGGGG